MKKAPNNIRDYMKANLTGQQKDAVIDTLMTEYGISEIIIDRDLAQNPIKKWRQKIWLDEIAKISPAVTRETLFPEPVEA